MRKYAKVHKTYEEQLALLTQRGLDVGDNEEALRYLENVGYYTFGGYLYTMYVFETENEQKVRTDDFLKGVTFENAIKLYEYDRRLRHHCFVGLETIERSLKVRLAYHVGKTDPLAHYNGKTLSRKARAVLKNGKSEWQGWLDRHRGKVKGRPNEEIKNWVTQYGDQIPIWIAIDAMDFGDASQFLGFLNQSSQTDIAEGYGLQSGPQIVSWIQTCKTVRNYAAHHQRLWNSKIDPPPMRPKGSEKQYFSDINNEPDSYWGKTYASLLVMGYLIRQIDKESQWTTKTVELLESLPIGPGVNYEAMGVPNTWRTNKTWS